MAEFTEIVKDYFTNAQVSKSALMDLLSEFLAVEQGGQELYEKSLELVFDSEVNTKPRSSPSWVETRTRRAAPRKSRPRKPRRFCGPWTTPDSPATRIN